MLAMALFSKYQEHEQQDPHQSPHHISSDQQHDKNLQGSIYHESDSTALLSSGVSRGVMGDIKDLRRGRYQ